MFVFLAVLLCFLPGSGYPGQIPQRGGDLDREPPGKAEIQARYRSLTEADCFYAEEPSRTPPYRAGQLTEECLQSGLAYLNYARFVANLPPVCLSEAYNRSAQQAALVCAANGTISHTPAQPAGMEDALFAAGSSGAAASNLTAGFGSLSAAVQACLDDFGPHNRWTVGHRRWFLSPCLNVIGMGYVQDFAAIQVVGEENFSYNANAVRYDFIAWPSSGNFPSDLISFSAPWSVTLNPERYQVPSRETLVVTVTRESDGTLWRFDSHTPEPDSPVGAYLTVSQKRTSVPLCVIFAPDSWETDCFSGIYRVDITGLTLLDGTPAELHYEIDFFDVTRSVSPGEEVTLLRLAGANRFETALQIADALKEQLEISQFQTIVVANGLGFADALSGSYLAAAKQAPILLWGSGESEELVKTYIEKSLAPGGTIYLLGGEAAVPDTFAAGWEEFSVHRLAGPDRFATNLAILREAGVESQPILVCTGLQFADSLSASALQLPVLLVSEVLTEAQRDFLSQHRGSFYLLGGESAVSRELEDSLAAYGSVKRLAGADRYETSALIAETFFPVPETAVLAYGGNFPDGLCGGSLAAALDSPLLLTAPGQETCTAAYVRRKEIPTGIVLGSSAQVSAETLRQIYPQEISESLFFGG